MAITKVSSELIKDNSITMDKMHTGVVVTTSQGLHNNANDTVFPTAGAVAAYVSSQVTGANNWDLSFAWGDHSTYGYATETYVDNSIANVINSAPAALDTLNELAAALGDDPNFATTVTNLIAGKQAAGTYNTIIGTDTDINTSGATIVDNIYVTDGVITSMGTRTLTLGDLGYTGATNANYITNNNQLTNGAGYITSFDITTQTDPKYLRSNADDTYTGVLSFGSLESKIYGGDSYPLMQVSSGRAYFGSTSRSKSVIASSDTIKHVRGGTEYDIWTAYNDGSGSGLDADLLDGLQGSQFLRSDTNDTTSGNLTISKSSPRLSLYDTTNTVATRPSIEWETTATQGVAMSMSVFDSELPEAGYGLIVGPASTNTQWPSTGNLSFSVLGEIYAGSESLGSVNKVWHAGNDGSGSGLDADLLDGLQGSQFLRSDAADTMTGSLTIDTGSDSSNALVIRGTSPTISFIDEGSVDDFYIHVNSNNFYVLRDAAGADIVGTGWDSPHPLQLEGDTNIGYLFGNKIWSDGNDGSGSGLDADLLDGSQGSAYIKENEDRRYKAIRFTGEGGNSSNAVINYGIYQEGGAWSSPFPDLVIGYHTGIKIGGYKNYNGTRFYNDAPGRSGASMILSVGDGSDDVVATSSLRAPIFYDSNDTSYYLNPASTSVLNYINVHRIYGIDGNIEVYDHLEIQDGQNVRLGTSADFRMWHDGSNHYFRNYNHANGNIYFQGEDTEGTNHALLYMITATSRPYIRLFENGGERLRTTSAGVDVYGSLTATGDITAFSDKRVKDNIETIPDALEKVKELNGVTFTRTDTEDKDRRHTGVIAQDVLKVLPEAVIGNEDEGMLSVAYGNMVGLLIEAIKEQQTQIDELKQLINKQ